MKDTDTPTSADILSMADWPCQLQDW